MVRGRTPFRSIYAVGVSGRTEIDMKIGFQELVVVFIVALIVLGPDKLPHYAKKLGQAVAQFRKYTAEATKDIRENIVEPLEEAQRPLKEAMEPITDLKKEMQGNNLKKSFTNIGKHTKDTTQNTDAQQPEENKQPEEDIQQRNEESVSDAENQKAEQSLSDIPQDDAGDAKETVSL